MTLFKVKRVTCEITKIDRINMIIITVHKNLCLAENIELRLVHGFFPSGTIQWESFVDIQVQEHVNQLMSHREGLLRSSRVSSLPAESRARFSAHAEVGS